MKSLIILAVCLSAVCGQNPRRPQNPAPQQNYQEYQEQNKYQEIDQAKQQYNSKPYETTTYIPIIRFDKEQGEDGSYKTSYETGNHIYAEETGFLHAVPPRGDEKESHQAQVQHGSFSYTAPNGEQINVEYTADENGFRATGPHLPTPPPVSPEVQKGLDLIYAGIKAQQEAAARDPSRAKEFLNNEGFYRGE